MVYGMGAGGSSIWGLAGGAEGSELSIASVLIEAAGVPVDDFVLGVNLGRQARPELGVDFFCSFV